MGALDSGEGGPPILQQYWLEKALWQNLGRHIEDLESKRPRREVEDYLRIISLEAQLERRKATAKVPSHGSAAPIPQHPDPSVNAVLQRMQ